MILCHPIISLSGTGIILTDINYIIDFQVEPTRKKNLLTIKHETITNETSIDDI